VSYWEKIVRVMKAANLRRILRAMPIMGRSSDQSDVESAWALYPAMQTCDIFQMELDVACSGMDQRKVHMLAREVAPKIGYNPPVCLHSPLLPGLQVTDKEGSFDEDVDIDRSIKGKMSKSIAKGAIWVNDTPEEIMDKYSQAFCPAKVVEGNPVMDHARMVVFPHMGELHVERPAKYGGALHFDTFEELAKTFEAGQLHSLDLKKAVGSVFVNLLEPVREYFENKPENLEKMRKLQVTR
jgi:tyrosyl-tRNA synthetase